MTDTIPRADAARLIDPEHVAAFEIMGPTIQFLTRPEQDDLSPCVMRGAIPPGVVIPLHRHADPETFIPLSGEVEGLVQAGDDFTWVRVRPGDVFHVPGGVKHAWRNQTREPAIMFLVSTSRIGRFFQELGTPADPGAPPSGPPSGEAIRRFLETSERYGYWHAGPEENARIGISLPTA